jgi:hypothetical protein
MAVIVRTFRRLQYRGNAGTPGSIVLLHLCLFSFPRLRATSVAIVANLVIRKAISQEGRQYDNQLDLLAKFDR